MSNLLSQDGIDSLQLDDLIDGRYRVIQILSTEAWGQTYLAQDTRRPSQPQCIIQHAKPIPTAPNYQDAIRHLFVREAAILERLADHNQIPQLLACFEDERGFYLVQELVSGYPLSVELNPEQPWNENQVIHLLLECLEPLAFVHSLGMRHGNLKPDHLLRRLQDGRLVLVNFDSMKQLHLSLMAIHGQSNLPTEVTNQGYQPPEQLRGMPCLASDVYAIGMMAIQACTGIHPMLFQADTNTGDILWQRPDQPALPSLNRGLVALLSRMVCFDVSQRYATAGEALEAVRQLIQNRIDSPPYPTDVVENNVVMGSATSPIEAGQHRPSLPGADTDTTGSTLLVGVGIGAVLSATVCGYVILVNPPDQVDRGPLVLEQATQRYQAGELPQAISLAESIPMSSRAYKPAKAAIERWQKHWEDGASRYQAVENAFSQGQWLEVIRLSQELPKIKYWQNQTTNLVKQALANADNDALERLNDAYKLATEKDFVGALDLLRQIPAGSTIYGKAQEKILEYDEKRQIKAVVTLQRAYDRAGIGDFGGALVFLSQIPEDTTVYAKAREKVREYTAKQSMQAEALLATANRQAISQDFIGAITSLGKVPTGTALDPTVQEKTAEYTEKLYALSYSWLQKAGERASQNDVMGAIALLEKIPLGTPAYGEAREQIARYTKKLPPEQNPGDWESLIDPDNSWWADPGDRAD